MLVGGRWGQGGPSSLILVRPSLVGLRGVPIPISQSCEIGGTTATMDPLDPTSANTAFNGGVRRWSVGLGWVVVEAVEGLVGDLGAAALAAEAAEDEEFPDGVYGFGVGEGGVFGQVVGAGDGEADPLGVGADEVDVAVLECVFCAAVLVKAVFAAVVPLAV